MERRDIYEKTVEILGKKKLKEESIGQKVQNNSNSSTEVMADEVTVNADEIMVYAEEAEVGNYVTAERINTMLGLYTTKVAKKKQLEPS